MSHDHYGRSRTTAHCVRRERRRRVAHAGSVKPCGAQHKHAHAGSRTRVTSMGGLYDAATLRALMPAVWFRLIKIWAMLRQTQRRRRNTTSAQVRCHAVPCPNAFKVDMRATLVVAMRRANHVRRSARKPRRRACAPTRRVRASLAATARLAKRDPTRAQTAASRSLSHTPKFEKLAAP